MIAHRLSPLLTPRSIAVIGASPKADSTGNSVLRGLADCGFTGAVYPVNPRHAEIEGQRCYSSLRQVGSPVDLAVLAVANDRLEATLHEVVEAGAGAAAIFASCVMAGDGDPPLADRLTQIARAAGLPVIGGNSMGFCNYEAGVRVNSYPFIERLPGPVTVLSHSGSVLAALANHNHRLGLNLAVSVGRELAVTTASYMDYALSLPSTRAIGLFLETVRDPADFVAALAQARAQDVPVVALKVGRSAQAARMAVSHSGAIAGDDLAYGALFDRWGVLRVDTLDELVATLLVMAQPRRAVAGGIAAIHDSGGERELVVDIAAGMRVPFARINAATTTRLAERLDYGLDPVNPLDAFGTGHDHGGMMRDCFVALLEDPDSALGMFFLDVQQDSRYSDVCVRACLDAAATTTKPVLLATNYSAVNHHAQAERITRAGVPVLDGTMPALRAASHALAYRDFRSPGPPAPIAPPAVVERWREVLGAGQVLGELESLRLLADYGIPVLPTRIAASASEAVAAAADIGFPVVLKSAMPGLAHKTEVRGVHLSLKRAEDVSAAYADLARRLGPWVLVVPHIGGGVELVLGVKVDRQFGPLVLIGAGGVLVELLRDIRAALAPIDADDARRLIESLELRPLLDGHRGARPADVGGLVDAVVRLSVLAADFADGLAELDINPFLVTPDRCVALDALVVPRR